MQKLSEVPSLNLIILSKVRLILHEAISKPLDPEEIGWAQAIYLRHYLFETDKINLFLQERLSGKI